MASNKSVDIILSAYDVAKLLKQNSNLNHHRIKVSVKGTITSLSRMIKINSSYLFIIEVDSCVPILVKDFQLQWHSQLQPGGSYIFQNLIMTTIEKGVSEPHTVMFAWKDSCLTETESLDDDFGGTDSLDDWLVFHGITADFATEVNSGHSCQQGKRFDNFVNYEGKVTSTQESRDGFYTIDDKISEIYIFNAHLLEFDSTPYLVCCERSLVREKGFSCNASSSLNENRNLHHIQEQKNPTDLKSIFRKSHLALKEMLSAINIRDSMLHLKKSNQFVRSAMKQLICEKSSSLEIPKKSNTFLDNFLCHDKHCPHTKPNILLNRVPENMSLAFLKLRICEKQREFSQSTDTRGNNFNATHYSFPKGSNKMLMGTIIVDSGNQLFFLDGLERLPLLILENKNDEQIAPETDINTWGNTDVALDSLNNLSATEQSCKDKCRDKTNRHLGQYILHPSLVSNLINKVIFVREFHIVTEWYTNSKEGKAKNQLMYLAFCPRHCLLFDEVDNPVTSSSEKSSELMTSNCSYLRKSTCNIYVETKLPLRAHYLTDTIEFEIFGQMLKTADNVDPNPSDFPNSRKRLHENLLNKEEGKNDCGRISSTSMNSSTPKHFNKRVEEQNPCNWESVSMIFSGPASKCYHHIKAGNLYSLDLTVHEGAFSFANNPLQKAALFCAVRQRIKVERAVTVKQLVRSTPVIPSARPPDCCIRDILSESFTDSVVSFCCLVHDRYAVNSSFHEKMSSPAFVMVDICLQVREMSTEEAEDCALMPIFIDTPKNAYCFGLVPGSVIRFICLERRVSQADKVYCRFTVASSLQVLALHPMEQISRLNNPEQVFQPPVLSDLPKVLLGDLWCFKPDSTGKALGGSRFVAKHRPMYTLDCHICMFFELIIKAVCSFCRETLVEGKCQTKRCRDDAYPVLKTQAVVLIDDGSSQATVTFHNSSLVAKLLTLTEAQWNDITDGLIGCGELLITKDGVVSSFPIAQLLGRLCSSSTVLRPCKMAVAVDKKSPCQHLVEKRALDEFQIREVKIGKTFVNTWCLPLLSLECFAVEEIE